MRKNKQIRIISGEFGGRLIDTPNTDATQPMGDRERMAIFNRLRDEIPNSKLLDAFAGSGALGLEALSLGASRVDFLEKNPEAIRTIKTNLATLSIDSEKYTILRSLSELEKSLESQALSAPKNKTYDIIFADPPYLNPQYETVVKITTYLKKGGYFVLSHPGLPEPPEFQGMTLISDKKYAAAHIKIYHKNS